MNTNITMRIDENTKQEAEKLFKRLGLSMSTAYNMFLLKAIEQQAIPFEVSVQKPNKESLKAIKEAEELKDVREFNTTEEYFKHLGINA